MPAERVADLSEEDLIARVRARLGAVTPGELWSGDDAALVATGDRTLLTTDTLVEHVDFELTWATGADLGWKLVAINASDVAAMGALPTHAVATVQTPLDLPLATFESLIEGLVAAGARWRIALVGGDISRAAELSLGMTVIGAPVGDTLVLRSGARPGDALCITGTLGGSAAGLAALQRGLVDRRSLDAEIADRTGADALAVVAARHLRPTARVEEASALARSGVHAMIDISDGLARDLARLVRASGAGCEVGLDDIPIHPEVPRVAPQLGIDPLAVAVLGGEDYELLVALDPDVVEDVQLALDEIGTPLTIIGTATDGAASLGGAPLHSWEERGWDHLLSR